MVVFLAVDVVEFTVDAGVDVGFVCEFVVLSLDTVEGVVSNVVVLTLTGLLVFCFMVCSAGEVSREATTSLVTLVSILLPLGVGAVSIVAPAVLLLTGSI